MGSISKTKDLVFKSYDLSYFHLSSAKLQCYVFVVGVSFIERLVFSLLSSSSSLLSLSSSLYRSPSPIIFIFSFSSYLENKVERR